MLPYEKFKTFGPGALTDEELLGIIIRVGTKNKDSVQLGRQIIDSFPDKNLLGLYQTTLDDLMKHEGIGEVKAIQLKCISELALRMSRTCYVEKLNFNHPRNVAEYYMESLRHERKEKVILILLDKKFQFISDCILSIGTIHTSVISPREIFVCALKQNAAQFMLLHNHPSGDPTPSPQDVEITMQLMELSCIMGLPLIDHIIIGDNRYVSLREAKYIK